MDFRRIGISSFVIALVFGAIVAAPFLADAARRGGREPAPSAMTRDAHANRLFVEQHLISIQRDPLYWQCESSSPARARYFVDFCFGEHVIDFSLDSQRGTVELVAHGDAFFTDSFDKRLAGIQSLTPVQTNSIRALLSQRLTIVPADRDEWQAPEYISAIESCIDGRPMFVARRFMSDQQFESLASDLVSATGLKLARTRDPGCI